MGKKRPRLGAPLMIRMSAELLKEIEELQQLYVSKTNASAGPMKAVTRADIIRWALRVGITAIRKDLTGKGGGHS